MDFDNLDTQEFVTYIASIISSKFTEEEKLAIFKRADSDLKELIAENHSLNSADIIQLWFIKSFCS